jgi:hypothetical protein
MSNDVNNLAHSFVAMAQAFERLPQVQAELDKANDQIEAYAKQVQRLEMRLIDRANEIDNLNAKVRTVEVERDHAETMFLETDERLQALRGIFTHFTHSVDGFIKASEPEPVAEHHDDFGAKLDAPMPEVKVGASEGERAVDPTPQPSLNTSASQDGSTAIDAPTAVVSEEAPHSVDPTSAPSKGRLDFLQRGAPDVGAASGESAASSTTGESAERPTSSDWASTNTEGSEGNTSGVSVPTDPTPATESSSTNVSDALASPQPDDVGYHNEPKVIAGNWHDWDGWCARMNARYGTQWPPRAQAAQ